MAEARDDETGSETDDPRHQGGGGEAGERLTPAVFRDEAGAVGADAEKRSMAERYDAGIAEDEVERERKQRRDGDLTGKRQVIRQQHKRQQHRQPERDLDGPPAAQRQEI